MRFAKLSKNNTGPLKSNILYIVVLIAAMGLKYHYSRAGSDELGWILGPTAWVVEHVSGIPFEPETGTGYVSAGIRYAKQSLLIPLSAFLQEGWSWVSNSR